MFDKAKILEQAIEEFLLRQAVTYHVDTYGGNYSLLREALLSGELVVK